MAGPDEVFQALEALQLDILETGWSNSIWADKFIVRPEELPIEYSENFSLLNANDTIDILENCSEVIKTWLSGDSHSRAQGSVLIANWSALSDVPYKKLLALLYYYITNDLATLENQGCVELALKSAELYYYLISIPGSSVYNIFQISIYEQCLKLFGIYKRLNKISSESRGNRDYENASYQRSILRSLNNLLVVFKSFLQSFSMKNQAEAMELTLTALADLTRCERYVTVEDFLTSTDKSAFTPLSRNAYLTLSDLCSELHGRNMDRRVLYHLMPNFSLQGGLFYSEIARWPPKEHTVMRKLAFWFLRNHIITKGEESLKNVRILIQHLCRGTIDRADYRSKATDLLVSIISLFPEKNYFAMLKWIFKEAFHDLVSQRMISLELISKLIFLKQGSVERSNMGDSGHSTLRNSSNSQLEPSHGNSIEVTNPLSSQSSNEFNSEGQSDSDFSVGQARIISFSKPIEYVPIEFRRMMLAIIINRCQDGSAVVRSKAFSILNEIISNHSSPTIQKLVRSIFVDPYASVSEIKFDEEENDFLSCDEFREVLDKANWDNVNNIMPGATKLHELIMKRCTDEKVVVRKAALMLVSHIYKLNIQWLSKPNLLHFGQHCRDPALSIRKEMQNLITDLMITYPQHTELTRMWVQGVVPLVGDTDPVVSKTAFNLLTRTILVNIKPLNKTRSTTDLLPWHLITHIAALKNSVFLKKAFHYWNVQREPELNDSKIDSVISHIGSPQDGACWVLLACYSEYIDIKRPQPIMDYYMNVISKGEGSFSVSHLVLKTLNNCCRVLTKEKQVILENELVDSLENQKAAVSLVQSIVTLRTNLRHSLAENEDAARRDIAKWTVEMAQVCEKRIELCLDPENEATGDSCLFELTLFGSIVDLHPNKISQSTMECILKFIKAIRHTDDLEIIKLQTLAIVTMGRISFQNLPTSSSYVHCLTNLMTHCRNSSILSNIIITLADIGERFPNLIDYFIPSLIMCLKHRSRDVRKVALEIIIELLQEDYVKPKGSVLFNLMTLIHDPVRQTVATVKSYLANCYILKLDKCYYGPVILQSMFYYNSYKGHHTFKAISTTAEEAAFNLSGPKMHAKRLAIYRFVLSRIPSADRYKCLTMIAEEILKDVQQNNIDLRILEGEQIILDTFGLVLTKNLVSDEGSKKKDDDEEGVVEEAAVTEKDADSRKAFIQIIVNHCIHVRNNFFKRQRLHHRFYFFVRELVRDQKAMIKEFFQENRNFGEEILREIETYPKQDWIEDFQEKPNNVEAANKSVEDLTRKRKSDEHLSNKDLRKKSKGTEMDVETDGEANELDNDHQSVEVNDVADSGDKSDNVEADIQPSQSNETNKSRELSSVTNSFDALKLKQVSVRLVKLPEDKQLSGSSQRAGTSKGKNQEKSADRIQIGKASKKRTVRASSDSLDNSGDLGIMLPPSRPSRTSRRTLSTPTVPNRSHKPPLFSSTPLISKPNGFNATDISPVVQNNSCDDDEDS